MSNTETPWAGRMEDCLDTLGSEMSDTQQPQEHGAREEVTVLFVSGGLMGILAGLD